MAASATRALRVLPVALAFFVMPPAQGAQHYINMTKREVVDRIVAQEQAKVESLQTRGYILRL